MPTESLRNRAGRRIDGLTGMPQPHRVNARLCTAVPSCAKRAPRHAVLCYSQHWSPGILMASSFLADC